MKLPIRTALALALSTATMAFAQNIAIVNGKPVPQTRVDALLTQMQRSGQQRTPELERQVRDRVDPLVLDEQVDRVDGAA